MWNCNSIRNYPNVMAAEALLRQPVANGVAIGDDTVRHAACHGLSDAPYSVAIRKHSDVPHGCDRDAIGPQRGRQNGEEVRVEAIGVDDLDTFAANVAYELQLSAQRPEAVHACRWIIRNRHVERLNVLHKRADSAQAAYPYVEPGTIKSL